MSTLPPTILEGPILELVIERALDVAHVGEVFGSCAAGRAVRVDVGEHLFEPLALVDDESMECIKLFLGESHGPFPW